MVNVKVYVEGGGTTRDLRTRCREGFASFFEKANLAGRMPRIVACGSRHTAFDKFRTALGSASDEAFIVLLVDSEAPLQGDSGSWRHLEARDKWTRPPGAADENAHLMVQCMEAWFLADRDGLETYFGPGFSRNALPGSREVENVAKADVLRGLRDATRRSKRGEYHKGNHSYGILAQVASGNVLDASPHAKRLVDTLREKASN